MDTGRAKAGWTETSVANMEGNPGRIENNVPYIGWLEFGTDDTPTFAMVRTTVRNVSQEYK